jgi:putative membrane protein
VNAVAQVAAGVSALVLIAVFPLEAFLIDRRWVQRFAAIVA